MRVLILDGNENQAVAATRSLARAGHRVEVGAPTSWSKAGWSRSALGRFVYTSPEADADAFVQDVARYAARTPGTLVLPMTERSTLPLSEQREVMREAGAVMVLPPHETLLRAFDKGQMTALAQSLGLAVPRSEVLIDREAALEAARRFSYPAVLKPRTSQELDESGQAVHATGAPVYALNEGDFLRAYDELRRRCREVLAQEWIAGHGAGYFVLMRHGELRAEFAHRRIRDVRPTGSGSALRESIQPEVRMQKSALELLESLQWHGVAMVEYRVPADGAPVFLELNGRFWNSLALPIYAGVDFPALLAEMAEKGDVSAPMPMYQSGVRCRWFLGDVRHLVEVWRGAPASFPGQFPDRTQSLSRFLAPEPGTRIDNFQWSDPLPEVGDWLDFVLHRIPGQMKKDVKIKTAETETPGATFKGAMHLHSTYSDGEFSLAELRELFMAAGCRFACVTDHAESFDDAKLEAYRHECEELSDDQFCFVAGLEYGCDERLHVLGYGLTTPIDSTEPQEVIGRIRAAGGICVIAHPQNRFFGRIEQFEALPHGIEVWNSKYDGRYAPRPATFALLGRMQRRDPALMAFYGQDLHWRKQFRGLFCEVECEELSRDAILAALATGRFAGVYGTDQGQLRLPSNGALPVEARAQLTKALRKARIMRRATTRTKGFARAIPAPLKAQIRRIF